MLPHGSQHSIYTLLRIRLYAEPLTLLPGGAIAADAAKPYLLSRECSLGIPDGIAAVASRKLLIVVTHSVSLTIAACLGYHWLESTMAGVGVAFVIASILFLFSMLASTAFILFSSRTQKTGKKSKPNIIDRWRIKHAQTIHSVHERIRDLRLCPKNTFTAAGLLLLVWFLEAFEIYLIGNALMSGINMEGTYIAESLSSIARSVFAFIPAGAGVQELSYSSVLSAMGMGVSIVAALSLVRRSREIAWATIGGIVFSIAKLAERVRTPVDEKQTGTLQHSVPVKA